MIYLPLASYKSLKVIKHILLKILIIFKINFQKLLKNPFFLLEVLYILFFRIRVLGLTKLFLLLLDIPYTYEKWMARYEPSPKIYPKLAKIAASWESSPLISVIMTTYNSDLVYLKEAIESVRKQVYTNWQLCIADDASKNSSGVKELLSEYAARDPLIDVVFRETNGHISAASNSALNLAKGDFVVLLDHDDLLHPLALWFVAQEIIQHPTVGLIYSDHDKFTLSGKRIAPYFKCDFNYELQLAQNLIAHLDCYRRSLLLEVGGFREGFEGSQDWDLALRCIERLSRHQIVHIPRILYHWRLTPESVAVSIDAKPYAPIAARRCLSDHLKRRGLSAHVSSLQDFLGVNRVKFQLPDQKPLVSIIIPTYDRNELLQACINSIFINTSYTNYEIIIVDNGSIKDETLILLKKLQQQGIRVIHVNCSFNYSRLNNIAAKKARGSIYCLMNNDIKIISPDWLNEMVSFAIQDDIGVVGARLWYPDGTLQHGGIILGYSGLGVAGHAFPNLRRGDPGYFSKAIVHREVSAVTGACMVVRRFVYEQVNGLDESLAVDFNDIDFCLKVRQMGYRNVWTPFAEMFHIESATRKQKNKLKDYCRFKRESDLMFQRWGDILKNDPFYSPNLGLWHNNYGMAWPPRIQQFK